MNSTKEENNMLDFDISRMNIPTDANLTFSMIHPSLASSTSDSFINRQNSSYFLTVASPVNQVRPPLDDLMKNEQLIEKKISYLNSDKPLEFSPPNDSYFNNTEYILYDESPLKHAKKPELEKLDLNENLDVTIYNELEVESNIKKIENILPEEIYKKSDLNLNQIISSHTSSEKTKKVIVENVCKEGEKISLTVEIKITGYLIKNIIFQHIKYILTIKNLDICTSSDSKNSTYKLYRRYSEFKKLRDMLMKKYIGIFLPSLPRKQIFRSTDINLIEFRKKFLQIFLHELQLCHFFNESEEIKGFLDPTISAFPPENLKIISAMNKLNEDFLFEEVCKNIRKTYKFNFQNTFIVEKNEKYQTLSANDEITWKNNYPLYKSLDISVIPQKLKNLNTFCEKLSIQKTFLENIRLCLNHFTPQQKDFMEKKSEFLESLIEFQNICIIPIMKTTNDKTFFIDSKNIQDHNYVNKDNYSEEKNHNKKDCKNIQDILEISNIFNKYPINTKRIKEIFTQKLKKTSNVVFKNLHDWIYKEIIDADSITECIGEMKEYLHRLSQIEDEIKMFDQNLEEKNKRNFNKLDESSPYDDECHVVEYANLDLKEKLENKKEILKEIVSLSTLNLHNFEIEKIKNKKFQYYYNSLSFLIEQNKSEYENEVKTLLRIIENILSISV